MTENEIIIDGVKYVKIKIILQNILSPKLSNYIDDLEIDIRQLQLIQVLNLEEIDKLKAKIKNYEALSINQVKHFDELNIHNKEVNKELYHTVKSQNEEIKNFKHQIAEKDTLLIKLNTQKTNQLNAENILHQKTELGKQIRTISAQNTALKWILHHHGFTHKEIRSSAKHFNAMELELLEDAIENTPLELQVKFLAIEKQNNIKEIERLNSLIEANSKQLKIHENLYTKNKEQIDEINKLKNEVKGLKKENKTMKPDEDATVNTKLKYLSNKSLIDEIKMLLTCPF